MARAASMKRSERSTNCAGDKAGPVFSSSFRKATTCAMFWAKTNLSPRDSTGTERAPIRASSARPAASVRILIDSNSIPRTERNSFSLRQLVQPGCQNAFKGAVSAIVCPVRLTSHVRRGAGRRQPPLLARGHARGYIAPMRRATILALIGILVVAFGAYTAFWWIAAGKIKLAAGDWAQIAHEKQIDLSWQGIRVAGYPFSFRLELTDAVATDKAVNPPVELRAPQISASIRP